MSDASSRCPDELSAPNVTRKRRGVLALLSRRGRSGVVRLRSKSDMGYGTILGVVLFRTLENGLNKTDINNYIQDVINWGAVIVAVLPPAITTSKSS